MRVRVHGHVLFLTRERPAPCDRTKEVAELGRVESIAEGKEVRQP